MEKLLEYLRGTKEEIRKVSWPSKKDTLNYSAVVVGASIIVAVFFATLDFGFTTLVNVSITQRNTKRPIPTTSDERRPTPEEAPTTSKTPTLDLNVKDIQTTPGSGAVKVTPVDVTPIQRKNE